MGSSILVVFHFGCLPFWSSSILVVFHFGRLPFWSSSIWSTQRSYPPAHPNGPTLPHSSTFLSSRTAQRLFTVAPPVCVAKYSTKKNNQPPTHTYTYNLVY